MGWEEDLFGVLDDLEQQAEAAFALERDLDLADRSRAEYAEVSLAGRLMASLDAALTLDVIGVGPVAGTLARVGQGWCLVNGSAQDWVVPLAAVAAVEGSSPRAVPEVAWAVTSRLGIGSALRRLADVGERCVVHRLDGGRHDGVLLRVGSDFVELREAQRIRLVALASLAAVQSREP